MSPAERLAALAAAFAAGDPERLLARSSGAPDELRRASSVARAPRRERLAALATACAPARPRPGALAALDQERPGVRRLAAGLCAGDPPPVGPARPAGRGPALLRRLLLERLFSEGA